MAGSKDSTPGDCYIKISMNEPLLLNPLPPKDLWHLYFSYYVKNYEENPMVRYLTI